AVQEDGPLGDVQEELPAAAVSAQDEPAEEAAPVVSAHQGGVTPPRGRDWWRLAPEESSRPQLNPTEAEREARGVTEQKARARKRLVTRVVVALVVAVLLGLGLRFWAQGVEYEAVCVDQRTMTRVVSGAACAGDDTNHRWWYVESTDPLPEVGESVDRTTGTFDEPSGSNNTITRHVKPGK